LKNEIVPKTTQTTPSFKLFDFLIYPSNGTFKNTILPFISSSENLLKIYFHFQKLHPNVNLEKFLPYSTIKKTVLDVQDSPFVYIFQNEYKSFNPIVFSENNYKICTINDQKIQEDDIYALFSPNKIFSLKTYILDNNSEVYAACDQENDMFFVALKTNQGKLSAISHGPLQISHKPFQSRIMFPEDLDCILKAHNLTGFSKIYFNVFDFYRKYRQIIWKPCTALKKLDTMTMSVRFILVLALLLPFVLLYHATIFPFHILSIPFEFFLWEKNLMLFPVNMFSENFMNFWILPYYFSIIFSICFAKIFVILFDDNITKIEPLKTMWAVKYLVRRKHVSAIDSICTVWGLLGFNFMWGIVSSLPFGLLFMIHGEAYNQ